MEYKVDFKVTTMHGNGKDWMLFEADNDVEALYKADKILSDVVKESAENGIDVTLEKISVSRIEQVQEQEMLCLYLVSRNGSVTEQWLSPEDKEDECSDGKTIAVAVCTSKELDESTSEEVEMYRKTAFEKLSVLEREKTKSIGETLSKNLKKSKTQERD